MKPPPIVNKLQPHVALNPLHGTAALHKTASTPGAQRLVALLESSTSHKSSGFAQVLSQYLHDRLAAGETLDDFAAALKQRAEDEARRCQQFVRFGQSLARRLRDPVQMRRLVNDVILPAERHEIDRLTAYASIMQQLRGVQRDMEVELVKYILAGTVTISVGVVAGVLVGGEKTIGVAFYGQPPNVHAFLVRTRAVQLGTVEVAASLQIEFSPGAPGSTLAKWVKNAENALPASLQKALGKADDWGGFGMGVGLGGGDGVTGGVAVAWTPDFTQPIYKWPFNSIGVEVGVGEGADLGIFLQAAVLRPLPLLRKKGGSATFST